MSSFLFLTFCVYVFRSLGLHFFSRSSFKASPPVAFYQGWLSLNLVRWVFNAEKPGAFRQEKTDTSYPRASLGSCHRQLLLTQPQQGRSGPSLVSFPYSVL